MAGNLKLKTKDSKLEALVPLLLDWFSREARDLPWRRTQDPYAIWVSEIMLQQTQVKTVIPYWEHWMRELPMIESVARAESGKIHKLWEGLGYYTRVRNLQKAAQQIVARNAAGLSQPPHDQQQKGRRNSIVQAVGGSAAGGTPALRSDSSASDNIKFPERFDDVLALPGIGRYTAGAICSIAFNQPTPILDGNVIRVLTRIFGIGENPREKETNAKLWRLAGELVLNAARTTKHDSKKSRTRTRTKDGEKFACSHLNQSLMELGALICTPRDPKCLLCPVRKLCVAFREGRVNELPNLGKREAATARHFMAFVVQHHGQFLVRQRPAGIVNGHLWEFPNIECNGERDAKKIFKEVFGVAPGELRSLCTIKHSITRYRITLEAFVVEMPLTKASGESHPLVNLRKLAFTSAHKKLLDRLAAR